MYQQLILIGHVGRKPEMRYTPGGKAVADFSLAVNEQKDVTQWFKVICWEKTAEIADKYLDKGSKVMVVGKIEDPRPYTNKSGELACTIEVTVRTLKFLGGSSKEQVPAEYVADPHANNKHDEDIPF